MKSFNQFILEKNINFDVVKYILEDCANINYKWNLSEKRLKIDSKENLHFIVYLDKILANNITDKYLIQKFICQQNSMDYLLLKDVDSRIKEEYGDVNDANDLGLFFKENLNINLGFIKILQISNLGLTEISWVSQLNSLTYLYCDNNQLKKLPELPGSLTYLYCYINQLKELPELPSSLTQLYCYYNQLKELPELPSSLTYLYCSNNQLKELPELPSNLTRFYCVNNPGYDSWKKDKKYNKFI